MGKQWWLLFAAALFVSYKMKSYAVQDINSSISAIDGGLMLGSVAFYLVNLHRAIKDNKTVQASALAVGL